MIKIKDEKDIVLTSAEYDHYFYLYREEMKYYSGPRKTFEQFVRDKLSIQQLNG